MNKVWILTREHNLYDQHGSYFVAAFRTPPTEFDIRHALEKDEYANCGDVMYLVNLVRHIVVGGGRKGTEDVWWNLSEQNFGN